MIRVGGVELDLSPGSLSENRYAGALLRGTFRLDYLAGFTLPRTPTNDRQMHLLASPDAPAPRPAYLPIVCDFGPYDRLYCRSSTPEGYSVEIRWADHPLAVAEEMRLDQIPNLGSFPYDPQNIEIRQDYPDIDPRGSRGEQYPDVDYGLVPLKYEKNLVPHLAFSHYRPWVNPHWLIRKALEASGFAVVCELADAAFAKTDIAYLLHENIGAGGEAERSVALSQFAELPRDIFAAPNSITNPGPDPRFYQPLVASEIDDPSGRMLGGEMLVAKAGYYEIAFAGTVATLPLQSAQPSGTTITEATDGNFGWGFAAWVRSPNGDSLALYEGTPKPQSGNDERADIWEVDVRFDLWLSEGQTVTLLAKRPANRAAYFNYENYNALAFQPGLGGRPGVWRYRRWFGRLSAAITCKRSWFDLGETLKWSDLLDPGVNLADVIAGVCDLYALRAEYDPATRTLSMVPHYDSEVEGVAVPGFLDEVAVDYPFDYLTSPSVGVDGATRPERVVAKLKDPDGYPFESIPEADAPLGAKTYTQTNPLFAGAEVVYLESALLPRFKASDLPERMGETDVLRLAPLLQLAEYKRGEVNFDIPPTIARYYGADEWIDPVLVREEPPEPQPGTPATRTNGRVPTSRTGGRQPSRPVDPSGAARVFFPEKSRLAPAYTSLAYAAHQPTLVRPDQTTAGPPLAYAHLWSQLHERDFASRYGGPEMYTGVRMTAAAAMRLPLSRPYLIDYRGRKVPSLILAIEAIANDAARLRMVGLVAPTTPFALADVARCASNKATVAVSSDAATGEAWATYTLEHAGDDPTSVTFEVDRDGAGFVSYVRGARLAFALGRLTFRVRVAYDRCAEVVGTGVASATTAAGGNNCGFAPGILYTHDVEAGSASARRAPDRVAFADLDEFGVSVDGADFTPYTEGTLIYEFTTLIFQRTAKVREGCDAFIERVTIEAAGGQGSGGTPTIDPCIHNPVLRAAKAGRGVAFAVDLTEASPNSVAVVRVKLDGTDRWPEYTGTPVLRPGRVTLTVSRPGPCSDDFFLYAYDMEGVLTQIQ